MAATDKGTAAAMGPMVLPSKNCVNGSNTTSKITNGIERIRFTNTVPSRYSARFSQNRWRSVTKINNPSGKPPMIENSVAIPTIWKVSPNAANKSSHRSAMQHLHARGVFLDIVHSSGHLGGVAGMG